MTIGPGSGTQAGPSQAVAGPSLPPHLQQQVAIGSDDEDDDYAPALPPGMTVRASQGPALPPHLLNRRRSPSPISEAESDEDSDVGPLPAPSAGPAPALSAAEEFRLREQRKQEEEEEERRIAGLKPKREAWMTVPPSALDSMAHHDPTKITKRGFNQNTRRGGEANKPGEETSTLWTETPEERAKRIDEEVMGKRKRVENAAKQETESQRQERKKREARDAQMRAQTDAYNAAAARTSTLVDVHQTKTQKEQEDERERKKSKRKHRKASRSPSPEAPAFWDREKMMGMGGRLMDEGKRREIIGSSSTDLGAKFGSGSYL